MFSCTRTDHLLCEQLQSGVDAAAGLRVPSRGYTCDAQFGSLRRWQATSNSKLQLILHTLVASWLFIRDYIIDSAFAIRGRPEPYHSAISQSNTTVILVGPEVCGLLNAPESGQIRRG